MRRGAAGVSPAVDLPSPGAKKMTGKDQEHDLPLEYATAAGQHPAGRIILLRAQRRPTEEFSGPPLYWALKVRCESAASSYEAASIGRQGDHVEDRYSDRPCGVEFPAEDQGAFQECDKQQDNTVTHFASAHFFLPIRTFICQEWRVGDSDCGTAFRGYLRAAGSRRGRRSALHPHDNATRLMNLLRPDESPVCAPGTPARQAEIDQLSHPALHPQ